MKINKKNNKQLVHKKTATSYISLPKTLVDDIQKLNLTKTEKSHSFKFVGILLRDSFQEFWDVTTPTPKPQKYLTKTFDTYYYKWLNILINNNIVIRNEYYSHDKSICYNYSVSPEYFKDFKVSKSFNLSNTLCNEKEHEPLLTVGYKDVIKNITVSNGIQNRRFIDDITTLKIDYDRLQNIVDKRVSTLSISEFKVNEQITQLSVRIFVPNGNSFFMKTIDAIAKAKLKGMSLINDNGRFRIADESQFIHNKKVSIDLAYTDSIEKMRMGGFRAARNGTNNRLDTNLTNMCSLLVDDICAQNNLVQIDLNNSQFTILSFILKDILNTPDFNRFKALSVSGKLYDYIKLELGLETKKQAKNAMFEIMFSSRKNNTSGKMKIKNLFPNVVKWIDDFKKENEDNTFAIMLQLKESAIFIDGILRLIKTKKIFCLTKHDSLIVKENDMDMVLTMVQEFFDKMDFEYNLSITNPADLSNDNINK